MLSSLRRPLVLVAVIGCAFALNACEKEVSIGSDSVSASELETQASKTLTAEYGEKPASIDCPSDLKAEVGETETCELVDQAGNHYDAKMTITSVDDDGNAKFNIKVGGIKKMGSTP